METASLPVQVTMRPLRLLLVVDSVFLFCLGALLLVAPRQVELVFHFSDLPLGVSYIIGLWGCVLLTMACGYFIAATDPLRHLIWVQVGIARGALECAMGLIYVARGIVTFQQAGLGIVVAALITLGYAALYPRERV